MNMLVMKTHKYRNTQKSMMHDTLHLLFMDQ